MHLDEAGRATALRVLPDGVTEGPPATAVR